MKTIFTTILCSIFFACGLYTIQAQVVLNKDGNFGVGLTEPARSADFIGSSLRLADRPEYPFVKESHWSMRHYENKSIDLTLMYAKTDSMLNQLYIGGGHKKHFASSNIQFYTSESLVKRNGKLRMIITENGNVGIGVSKPPYKLYVHGTAGKPGGGEWLAYSDKRLKTNISIYDRGLSSIRQIEPQYFQYLPSSGLPSEQVHVGIMAQDWQLIAPQAVQSVPLVDELGRESEYLTIDASEIKYMLVNAVKEIDQQVLTLQAENAALQDQVSSLQDQVDETNDKVAKMEKMLLQLMQNQGQANGPHQNAITLNSPYTSTGAYIRQNLPNPMANTTRIAYHIPESSQKADISFYDVNGRLIHRFDIDQRGNGQLEVNRGNLVTGVYMYALSIDGQRIDTKRMVVQTK